MSNPNTPNTIRALQSTAEGAPFNAAANVDELMTPGLRGVMYGFPGFTRQGLMPEEAVFEYVTGSHQNVMRGRAEAPHRNSRTVRMRANAGEAGRRVLAYALYGDSATPYGMEARKSGLLVAHMQTLTVSDRTHEGATPFTEEQLFDLGLLTLRATARDIEATGAANDRPYNRLAYMVEETHRLALEQLLDDCGVDWQEHGVSSPIRPGLSEEMNRTHLSVELEGFAEALETHFPQLNEEMPEQELVGR